MKIIICKECGKSKPHGAHGLCGACYQRMRYPSRREADNRRTLEYYNLHKEVCNKRSKMYKNTYRRISFLGKRLPAPNTPKPPERYLWHHVCYDHINPEACIIMMTRSDHTKLHRLLNKYNIEIPHINAKVGMRPW